MHWRCAGQGWAGGPEGGRSAAQCAQSDSGRRGIGGGRQLGSACMRGGYVGIHGGSAPLPRNATCLGSPHDLLGSGMSPTSPSPLSSLLFRPAFLLAVPGFPCLHPVPIA